jgi:outer membrane protein assembly factor BamB
MLATISRSMRTNFVRILWFCTVPVLFLGSLQRVRAADWPTWRFDGARSAASPAPLPTTLHAQWTRQLSATVPAWPNEPRLHFDTAYEPIVSGDLLVVGSPNDGSVTAYDVTTGEERWKFFAEGPVRFAPTADSERVYFGSDDGRVYCLAKADGRPLWDFRVAPEDRPDRRHLGNGRLISYWPVRGGPVLADGTLYCGAGVWPTMGVFVAAIDAASGKLIWRNDDIDRIEEVRIDHNLSVASGLSPQGYLAVDGETLIVPNGRSLPAMFDRKTGKLRHYLQGYRNGDSRVTVQPPYLFVGESGVMDMRTGREVGSRAQTSEDRHPKGFEPGRSNQFESTHVPYKLFPGCSWRSVLGDGTAYDFHQGTFTAYDTRNVKLAEYQAKGITDRSLAFLRWDPPQLWTLDGLPIPMPANAKTPPPVEYALIGAGEHLYVHAAGTLAAVDFPSQGRAARLAWKQPLEGTPAVLVAAADRLFAVTREGTITCFGAQRREVVAHPWKTVPIAAPDESSSRRAAEILRNAQVKEGYCVMLGIGTGRLACALLSADPNLKLIAVDADAEKIRRLRTELGTAGWYGTRAEALVGAPAEFPLPPYVATLVISDDDRVAERLLSRPAGEPFEHLRPYGGAFCLSLSDEGHQALVKWASTLKPNSTEIRRTAGVSRLIRTGALEESASWTHQSADPARTFFSRDRLARPPFGVLWYGDGDDYGFWKKKDYNTGVKPQVVGGRCYGKNGETLAAYDVYTGRKLWETKVPPRANYVSLEHGIYVADGNACRVYDPVDGRSIAEFTYHVRPDVKEAVLDLRVSDRIILLAVTPASNRVADKGLYHATALVALDRRTGRRLWVREAKDGIDLNAVALAVGKVWCVDAPPLDRADAALRRGVASPAAPSTVLALDEITGEPAWSRTLDYEIHAKNRNLVKQSNADWLGYSSDRSLLLVGKLDQTFALRADDGAVVWKKEIRGQPMMLGAETFINQYGQTFDTANGEPKAEPLVKGRFGCNYLVANEFCIFGRDASASFVDRESGRRQGLFVVRSGCSNSTIAADGLLNVPNFAVGCICNYPVQSSFALFHSPEAGVWLKEPPPKP